MITRSYHLMFWKKYFEQNSREKQQQQDVSIKDSTTFRKFPFFCCWRKIGCCCCVFFLAVLIRSMPTSSHFPSFGGNLIRYELCFLTLYTIIFSIFLPFFPRFAPFASVSLLISHDRIHLNGTASRGGGERRDDTKLILLVFFCRNCGKLFR